MYALLGIDTVLRITLALAFLAIAVPALAWRLPRTLEEFWWNFAAVVVVLTLAGQIFTLLHIAGTLTYLTLIAAIVIACRARRQHVSPIAYIASSYRALVLASLRLLDGRLSIRRRIRRGWRRAHFTFQPIWIAVIAVAAAFRLYRPFATANLGFSDTYVHLYLMRLLDAGRQIDPAWGPYPRGMHFLLLAIQRLTNTDEILLMNFFGAFSGILMTLAAAYAAKRIARNNVAALVAGLIFATMVGGARQYFALGGSVSSDNPAEARENLQRPYDQLADAGEFDVLLTAFERQTSTLPQELAIAFLFPAALFLIDWFRSRDAWHLSGFVLSTAAIAAIHSGVVIPLVLLCAAAAIAALLERSAKVRDVVRGAAAGAIGIAIGSTWLLGFLVYRRTVAPDSKVGSTALYYFPFLRPFVSRGELPQEIAYMMLTPFLIAIFAIAVIVVIHGLRRRDAGSIFAGIAVVLFIATHAASTIGIPEIVEVRRNASWLAMAIAMILGIAATYWRYVPAVVVAAWLITIPNLFGAAMRSKLLDYSGYGTTTYAVLEISNQLQPFTWTLVSYGQEYPMVLGRGFHLNGADFLQQFDPGAQLAIPTPYVFIAVEKNAHPFQINNWSTRFDRSAIEERLQTWCTVYRMTHSDMRIWLDDDNVRVYAIERPKGRLAAL